MTTTVFQSSEGTPGTSSTLSSSEEPGTASTVVQSSAAPETQTMVTSTPLETSSGTVPVETGGTTQYTQESTTPPSSTNVISEGPTEITPVTPTAVVTGDTTFVTPSSERTDVTEQPSTVVSQETTASSSEYPTGVTTSLTGNPSSESSPMTVPPEPTINTSSSSTPITTLSPSTLATTTETPLGSVCTAVQSGAFEDSTTWSSGRVPDANCLVTIPTNIDVTCTGAILNINIQVLIIEGSFTVVSTGSVGFAFAFSINIMIRGGGTFQDHTNNNQLCFQSDSVLTILPGASFVGASTRVFTCSASPPTVGVGASVTVGSSISGPYTLGVLLDGTIQTFGSIMCLARRTGSFTQGSSWLGLTAPTVDFCASVGGCDLYIPSGVTLDTESLNGVLNIQFNLITVTSGGIFQLGTTGVAGGFSFFYQFIFIIYGQLGYVSSDNTGIRIPFGSDFNLFAGASISATLNVSLLVYNPTTNATAGPGLTLQTGTSSGVFVAVSSSGDIEQNSGGTFIAARTGSFDVAATWIGGVVPSGNCSVIIPANLIVDFTGGVLSVSIRTLTIDGTFTVISTGGVGFGFTFSINIIVRGGGTFQDQTDNNQLCFQSDSIFTILPSGSFIGSNTQVFTCPGSPPTVGVGVSVTVGSSISGPYTLGVLLDGSIRSFSSIMCLARQSGSFSQGSSWLGLIAPTVDFCASVGGCDLYIPSGFTLSTASLNGVLNIQFNVIIINYGATFEIGTSGSLTGFRFTFSVIINCYGYLTYVTGNDGGIFVSVSSSLNLFTNGTFTSGVATFLQVYDASTGGTIGAQFNLTVSINGPFFIVVSSTGDISTNATSKCNLAMSYITPI